MEVEEIVYLRVLQALDLQLRISVGIGRHKRRRGNTEHVLRELFLVHQLRPGHAEQLDADTHEADIVDIRCNVRARPGKADRSETPNMSCVNFSSSINFGPGTPSSLMLILMKLISSISGVM